MIIFDTSVWIAFFKKQPDVFETARVIMEDGEALGLECVFGELLQGAKNARERDLILSYWDYLPRPDLENVWIEAGRYSGEHKLVSKGVGLIDAVIIIAATWSNAKVWTLDRKLLRVLQEEMVFDL
jgi:predicted nucleic acid-binding protein